MFLTHQQLRTYALADHTQQEPSLLCTLETRHETPADHDIFDAAVTCRHDADVQVTRQCRQTTGHIKQPKANSQTYPIRRCNHLHAPDAWCLTVSAAAQLLHQTAMPHPEQYTAPSAASLTRDCSCCFLLCLTEALLLLLLLLFATPVSAVLQQSHAAS
jgi:hypothetical protein